jgi:hypothetical protein
MSILHKYFEKSLKISDEYAETKKKIVNLSDSVDQLSLIVHAHHSALTDLLLFQKELLKRLSEPHEDIEFVFDELKLN